MDWKKYLGAALALFVFVFLYDWAVHSFFLMDLYDQFTNLWRSPEEMQATFPLMIGIQLFNAAWLTLAFTRFYKEGGIQKGLIFGIFIGLFAAVLAASPYVWLPISSELAWSWFFTDLIKWVIGGLIIGAIYKRD